MRELTHTSNELSAIDLVFHFIKGFQEHIGGDNINFETMTRLL